MPDKNFTVYKSSAGSGKTFTLVKEYLALALNDPSDSPQAYRHILAVTFTNKAAAEMKERIIKALKDLAEDDYSSISAGSRTLLSILKEHKKLNASGQLDDAIIRKRAKNVLTAILHNYSDFAIGTIDSFVHKVVRTFAFDLKIPMSFEIEMDDDKLLGQAIDLLIAQIGNDEKLTKALVEFTESKTDDEKSWHIEHDLQLFAKNLLNEEGAFYIEKLRHLSVDDFFKIKDVLFSEIKKFESSVIKAAEKACTLIKNSSLTAKEFYYGDKGIAAYFEKLSKGRMDYIAPNTYVQCTCGEDKWYGGKISEKAKGDIDAVKSALLDCFNAIQIIKDNDHSDYILFDLINKNIYSLAVLNEIEKLLNEYKQQNNILHISEFNKMIAKIVLNEPIPFIYERLGERYNNYLIDEFQDTSVMQFQNLLPLIDNSLAQGHFTMLVGDGKQAIYRWRGGEVEQFALLPEVFKHNDNPLVLEREEALIRNHDPQVLDKNFRSKREVIEFNNLLFKCLSDKLNDKYKNIYKGLEQGFNPANTGGFVQVEFIEGEKEEFRGENMSRTLEIIHQLQTDNYKLKDIAILVRKNTDGSEIANYLTGKGIEVISSDSLLLSNSAEVNFLHSLLKYLSNTSDTIIQTEILEYLIASAFIKTTTLEDTLNSRTGISAILHNAKIDFSVTVLSKMALYELCEELIRIFRLNAIPNAYIQFFLDEVLNYSIKKNNNLNDFIVYWDEKRTKASLIVPQGMDAVSIMTIHRSKGLEFPVVILPFSNSEVSRGKKNLWIDLENEKLPDLPAAIVPANKKLNETPYGNLYEEETNKSLLDNLNVLYVGLTRAEERMYVLSGKPGRTPANFGSTSDMLAYYYQSKGEWQEEKKIYTFGEAMKHVPHKAQQAVSSYELLTFNSNRWRENIKMRAAAPSIWNTNAAEVKKDYGVLVHTALAKIKTAADVIPALNAMCGEGLITTREMEELTTTLSKIVRLPGLAPHFAEGLTVKNEAEIVTLTGELFRPDRVVIRNKTAVIIDYKTGEERKDKKYEQQIIGYSDLLVQMGYVVTERLLVYIEKEKVVSC
ncbi:MAG TPA: UvrD-helicase domain-containing protein [Bacteroidia bacterium]|jgi:ATP-dependent exoDNAse (exonuclease V) beta subunit